ncbi:MAG: ParB/RepB/Spo0J family partition protein [Corynebacterium sp.]|nr:ParB/RepB/Spo0J family partition protein [Corynebacterium sp.]
MANNQRKGGLGRGLGALISSSASIESRMGESAADIILGTGQQGEATQADHPDAKGQSQQGRAAMVQTQQPQGRVNPLLADAVARNSGSHSDGAANEFGATYREIPIGQIVPNAKNPRAVFDPEELAELVHSIREFGLLQPIVVRAQDDGYEIIMGERRWRAAAKAGLKEIPAIVRETDDGDMLRDALLENIHRVQLNPLEEAAAYQQLLEEFGVTHAELAEKLGRSRPVISNMIRLLSLPVSVQQRVAAGVLSAGHARALLGVQVGPAAQEELAARIVAEGLSVRATEEAVTLLNRGEQDVPRRRQPTPTPAYFKQVAAELADGLDTKVSVSVGKRKGKIVVEFGDKDDFERIMGLLQHQEDNEH